MFTAKFRATISFVKSVLTVLLSIKVKSLFQMKVKIMRRGADLSCGRRLTCRYTFNKNGNHNLLATFHGTAQAHISNLSVAI